MRIASKTFDLPKHLITQIKFISPNIYELNAIAAHLGFDNLLGDDFNEEQFQNNRAIENIKKSSEEIAGMIDNVIVTLGSNGVFITRKNTPQDFKFFDINMRYIRTKSVKCDFQHRFYNAKKLANIVNVSGAGDSFNVGFIIAMINNLQEDVCISVGIESAKAALQSTSAVPDKYFGRNHECFYQPTTYKVV